MNELEFYEERIFDDIKHIDEYGNEYWYARELQKILEYTKWVNFVKVIEKAKTACKNGNFNVLDHFSKERKLSTRTNNTRVLINDYKLTRHACYLIIQNASPRKKPVALGKAYIAYQTMKWELIEKNKKSRCREDTLDAGLEELANIINRTKN